jgi:platelet-activating factor acetylhydrolase
LNEDHSDVVHYQPYDIDKHETEFSFRHAQLNSRLMEMKHAIEFAENLNQGNMRPDFKDQLKSDEFVAAGHSKGAATCLYSACYEKRFSSLMLMDPWMMPLGERFYADWRRHIPTVIVNADTFHWEENLNSMHQFALKNGRQHTKLTFLEKTRHNDFSDLPVYFPFITKLMNMTGENGGQNALDLTVKEMLGWMNKKPVGDVHVENLNRPEDLTVI